MRLLSQGRTIPPRIDPRLRRRMGTRLRRASSIGANPSIPGPSAAVGRFGSESIQQFAAYQRVSGQAYPDPTRSDFVLTIEKIAIVGVVSSLATRLKTGDTLPLLKRGSWMSCTLWVEVKPRSMLPKIREPTKRKDRRGDSDINAVQ